MILILVQPLVSLINSHLESRPDVLIEMQQTLYRIYRMGVTIVFTWVPAHICVLGNKLADKIAKGTTKKGKDKINVSICRKEVKNMIKSQTKGEMAETMEKDKKGRWYYGL